MKLSELLQISFDRINDSSKPNHGWCQFDYAKDANGNHVIPQDSRAVQFCSVGTIDRTLYEQKIDDFKVSNQIRSILNSLSPDRSISRTNDEFPWELVALTWQQAIAKAKEMERMERKW